MLVRCHRIDKSLPLPSFATAGSCGFDFYARHDTTVPPGQIALIPSNLIIECPEGYALLITPRSSLPRKTGLTFPHSIGVIDRDYCGPDDEIMLQVHNSTNQPITVERGTRLAQGLFVAVAQPQFAETALTTQTSRGGFGSTGA